MKPDNVIACHECDLLLQRPPRLRALVPHCPRCGARVSGAAPGPKTLDRMCALALAALLMYCVAQIFPIVALDAAGVVSHATLADAVRALWSNGQPVVAVLVFGTTMLFPLLELAAWLYLLAPLRAARVPRRFAPVLHAVQRLRPWSMVEVLMLGVLVTMVKMTSVAHVIAGPALFAFAGLAGMLAFLSSIEPAGLWNARDELVALRPSDADDPVPSAGGITVPDALPATGGGSGSSGLTAHAAGLIACHHCARVQPAHAHGQRCTRCGSPLHARRPRSVARTAALAAAAALLYIPANLLPVMRATSLGGPRTTRSSAVSRTSGRRATGRSPSSCSSPACSCRCSSSRSSRCRRRPRIAARDGARANAHDSTGSSSAWAAGRCSTCSSSR